MKSLRGRHISWYVAYTLAVVLVLAPNAHAWCPLDRCTACDSGVCVGSCYSGNCGFDITNIFWSPYCYFFECWEGTCYRMDGLGGPSDPCYVCWTDYFRCCVFTGAECDQGWG